MSISVVMSVYNGALYLEEAVQSILAQTLPPTEVIVVNDGSSDHTGDILAGLGSAITTLTQANKGAAAGLNRGLEAACGEWVAFLDADDVWLPEKLECQSQAIYTNPSWDGVFGYMQQFVSPDLDEVARQRFDCPTKPEPAWSKGTALLRRSLFDRVGLFDTRWQVGEFIDWFLRAQEFGAKMLMLDQVFLRRRWHAGNLTKISDPTDYARIIHAWRQRGKG